MTPAHHGYRQCEWCGVWQPWAHLVKEEQPVRGQAPIVRLVCRDAGWCGKEMALQVK